MPAYLAFLLLACAPRIEARARPQISRLAIATVIIVHGILAAPQPAQAAKRSSAARAEFQREHPCPSTGKRRGRCPGYVVDHVVPLCAGGPDRPSNMQWQTIKDGRRKDKEERQMCR